MSAKRLRTSGEFSAVKSHPEKSTIVKDRTSHNSIPFSLEWTIQDFNLYRTTCTLLHSPGITASELGINSFAGRFRIGICPCVTVETGRYVSAFLTLTDADAKSKAYTGTTEVNVTFTISATTGNAMDVHIGAPPTPPTICSFYSPGSSYGHHTFVSHAQLFGTSTAVGLLKDDVVTFRIEVTIYGTDPTGAPEAKTVRLSKVESPVSLCYGDFRRRQMDEYRAAPSLYTDFILRTSDGQEFPVNRFLLAAHSPVFSAMLTHDSQENQQAHCDLTDVDEENVGILLDYLYGCDTDQLNTDNVEKVLFMADKYQIMDLRSVCEGMMAESVTVDNVVNRFLMARQRGLDVLKDSALRIMAQNKLVVLKDKVLKAAIQSDPDLLEIIMEYCAK
ncbi:speckle-type POZ protein-like [Paramacrobiotus metropolitanus]|uniref:speckle-type POZ protein-like n=1 Tax=Paramacrobiotus metropolitanus TaxID=2943436 RepID=UPI0024464D14|nr:speckle-type POZ protein-like [Paramacrobiotus metropolitanus]